jgi:UDPglucose 6-dehydrogenase
MRTLFPEIKYAESVKDALKGSEACLIITEWDEFRKLEDRDFKKMKNKIIIEGRKVLDRNRVKDFEGICW